MTGDAECTEEQIPPAVCKVRSVSYTEGGFWILFLFFLLFVNVYLMLHLLSAALQDGHTSTAPKREVKVCHHLCEGREWEGVRINMFLIVH